MRTFIIVSHTAPLEADFSLDDLAGGAGRLDVLCRYVTAAFLLSHGIRTDVSVKVVIRDTLVIEFIGTELRHLRPDERSTAALFRQALETATDRALSPRPVESTPGVYVRRQGFERTLADLPESSQLIRLHESGKPLPSAVVDFDPVFVLSDHIELTDEEEDLLSRYDPRTHSVGPVSIHGDHAITLAHNRCDIGEAEFPPDESIDSGERSP